jgi:hypothetical protein
MKCENPECTRTDARVIPSMTAYAWDGKGENPNHDPVLCGECADDYRRQFNPFRVQPTMTWDEYYSRPVSATPSELRWQPRDG